MPIKLILDISTGEQPPAMLAPFTPYPWVVRSASGQPVSGYTSAEQLCASLGQLINPLESMVVTLEKEKAEQTLGIEGL